MGGTGGGGSVMVMLCGGDRSYDGRRGQPWANHVDDVLRCALTLRADARARRSTKELELPQCEGSAELRWARAVDGRKATRWTDPRTRMLVPHPARCVCLLAC